jgi:type IV secretory pathway component VirB8
VANVVFVVKDRIPNALIPVNPLGLTITYFRADQAFQ